MIITHRIQGQVDSYDLSGQGGTLRQALEGYAQDARASAERYREIAAGLDIEAKRAENAARACVMEGDEP